MILSFFLLILIILIIAVMLFFLFMLFLPSLRAQKINAEDPLFSKEEVEAVVDETILKHDGNFLHIDIGQERLLSLFAGAAGNIVEEGTFLEEQKSLENENASSAKAPGNFVQKLAHFFTKRNSKHTV